MSRTNSHIVFLFFRAIFHIDQALEPKLPLKGF